MSTDPGGPAPRPTPRVIRPPEGRFLVGVCAGVAGHLGVPVRTVRWVFLLLILVGGSGVLAYLLLWVLTPSGDGTPMGSDVQGARARAARIRPALLVAVVGVVVLGLGLGLLFAPPEGVRGALGSLFPVVAVLAGAVLAWSNLDDASRRSWLGGPQVDWRRSVLRIAVGVLLALAGILVLATRSQGLAQARDVGVASIVVVAGLAIVLAPWGVRMWHRLQEEQASRARAQERADIAAHLHDSVLQTLALIQRTDDPSRATQLARRQERELRSWLYGATRPNGDTLAAAVAAAVEEVEDLHPVPVDLVVTGDRPLDEPGTVLVAALREAVLNAVRHGQPPVSTYVEVGPSQVEAFVRDHGPGFDLADVPGDRLGVRESILGRMARHGGKAQVRRLANGTEVSLCLPVEAVDSVMHDPDLAPPEPTGVAGSSEESSGER